MTAVGVNVGVNVGADTHLTEKDTYSNDQNTCSKMLTTNDSYNSTYSQDETNSNSSSKDDSNTCNKNGDNKNSNAESRGGE